MVVVSCSVPNCDFTTDDVSEALAIALLNNHGHAHFSGTPGRQEHSPTRVKGPKLERPQVNVGVSTEEWNIFIRRWEVFRTGSGIDDVSAPSQLFQCAGTELGDSILKSNANATSGSLADLISAMKSLAVIPVATGVLRTELLQMRQSREEQFRAYAARVRGKAETCEFMATCACGREVDYTDHSIRDALLSGIYDPDIRREVLGTENIIKLPVNDVIAIVENKEMARNALPTSTLSAVSSFVRQRSIVPEASPTTNNTNAPDHNKMESCPACKKSFRVFSKGPKGWNVKPHQYCIDCFRAHRRNQRFQNKTEPAVNAIEGEPLSQISTISSIGLEDNHRDTLEHHVFTDGKWRKGRLRDHPRLSIVISVDRNFHKSVLHTNRADVTAIADTGAQSDLWPLSDFVACGFPLEILSPARLNLSAANTSDISVEGAFFATIKTNFINEKNRSCHSMIYVSKSVRSMFLSQETLLKLGILHQEFPNTSYNAEPTSNVIDSPINAGLAPPEAPIQRQSKLEKRCSCPLRTIPPQPPSTLPFSCCPENNSKMKEWLLNRYGSSTFNTCPHRALPCMSGPPVEIHVDPDAITKACHTPAKIPIHWQQQVHDDLLRDEALGVIERVPYGEPVTWCHRMVVTRKHDGNPRRTVDLSPLNKFCKRETFATESPFQLARRVPKYTWKTVTDAWNGYHSVPLRESDRHLTTFITPFGRWRYTRAPQGFVSSGDGYNRRFDAILSNFLRKERCVDDTIHYDSDLKEHWWRTINFLTTVGQAGIILNPSKFQFAEKTVDFAGFRVSDTTIEPLPKYLNAIRDFPTPISTTDVRSWFGLVNQVSNYGQLRDIMAPFKPFLSPRHKFFWNTELNQAFLKSKECIIQAIRHGVEIFDLKKRTCLRPDWSQRGIGYFLMQQWCDCPSGIPGCCTGGWRITLAGSRFLNSAEERYAAVEGEALAVAWGLEQTRYFTLGCDNLVVVTDHKPLVKLLGDRTLDEITNTRLFRLKQRTLPWQFNITHLPGKSNLAADATSRYPVSSEPLSPDTQIVHEVNDSESAIMSSISEEVNDVFTMTWPQIAQETSADTFLRNLIKLIREGFTLQDKDSVTTQIWHIRDSLYEQNGVILYQDRVFIPASLRPRVLKNLHAAHQGISAMEQRARAIVFWPGMTSDIREIRESCTYCNRNAPSQAATPPIESPIPSTPFESIFADFFDYKGRHFLVVGDRLSGWVEVYSSTSGTSSAGASGLVRHLRSLFATFGVPEELSSDGGPEFLAGHTQDFLKRWGVRHRISSAYFPQSNGRAEVAVKKAKRLLLSNTSSTGSLDNDRFLQAMLQLRNTPDPDCNISPSQIMFGRPIRDALSFVNRLEKYSNPHVNPIWREAWMEKESAMRTRMTRSTESLSAHTRPLRPLDIGELVFIQNQQGPHANKWDRTGIILENLGNDQYLVKVDGSGRLTRRNRRFLRVYTHPRRTMHSVAAPSSQTTSSDQGTLRNQGDHPFADAKRPAYSPAKTDETPYQSLPSPVTVDNPETECPSDAHKEPTVAAGGPVVQPSPISPLQPRSKRAVQPPKRYEPETGKWI